jgi:hypothetical protein
MKGWLENGWILLNNSWAKFEVLEMAQSKGSPIGDHRNLWKYRARLDRGK